MALEISEAAGKVLLREAARPAITYPENLPVSQKKQEILEAVRDHSGDRRRETSSGKTTQLPKICMELGRGLKGLIGHTQPRRWRRGPSPIVLPKSCRASRAAASAIKSASATTSQTPWLS